MFSGSMVALVTPMTPDGAVDFACLERLVDWHAGEGTDALVIAGTTGESATLGRDEHIEVVRVAAARAAGRVPVIAGTGSNSTAQTIDLSRAVARLPIAGYLVVVPYYNKPTQEGLYRHFWAVADAVEQPVMLYNVPGRTVADLTNDTALRLAEIPNVVGIKDATGSIDRCADLIRRAPEDFAIYSGDDLSAIALMLLGGRGNISVTANVAPQLMHEMCDAALAGDAAKARAIHFGLLPLHHSLFVEANPIPVKWAAAQMGLIGAGIRLPLTPLSAAHHERLRQAMRNAGIAV